MAGQAPNHQTVLILAAGQSSRMGEPKQRLRWQGRTLLRRACDTALATGAAVFVALGARASDLREEVPAAAQPLYPTGWRNGMGSTIADSLQLLQEKCRLPAGGQLLIMTADQPLLATDHLLRLFAACQADGAAASATPGQPQRCGVPAVFSGPWLAQLAQLSGDQGARELLRTAQGSNALTVLPLADCPDIDTPEDWQALQRRYSDQPA
jgi:molybdenum cofactor cytidylyltransferase